MEGIIRLFIYKTNINFLYGTVSRCSDDSKFKGTDCSPKPLIRLVELPGTDASRRAPCGARVTTLSVGDRVKELVGWSTEPGGDKSKKTEAG